MSLDPIIMKGIYLLRSKSKESSQQLRDLIDEVIEKSKDTEDKSFIKEYDPIDNIEKLKRDIIDLGSSNFQIKKLKSNNSEYKGKSEDQKFGISFAKNDMKEEFFDDILIGESVLIDDSPEKDTFDYNIGIACIVCKKSAIVSQNKIIECLDCHSLYHQECHTPKVSEDVNDPRFVWYCHICSIKEEDVSLSSPPYQTKELKSLTQASKVLSKPKRPENLASFPFKRPEQKSPLHFGSGSANNSNSSSLESISLQIVDLTSPSFDKNGSGKNSNKGNHKLINNNNGKSSIQTSSPVSHRANVVGNKVHNLQSDNKVTARKAPNPAQGPVLTGLAGLAANLLRQGSPNSTSSGQSSGNGNGQTGAPKSPQNPFFNAPKSHFKSTSSDNNPTRPKSSASNLPHRPAGTASKKLSLSNTAIPTTNRPSGLVAHKPNKLATNPEPKIPKISPGNPNLIPRERTTSSSNSATFNPPTMKDFEKRLQKMKKKKIP